MFTDFFNRSAPSDPLADLPLAPHGLFTFDNDAIPCPVPSLAALLKAVREYGPTGSRQGAVFVLGVDERLMSTMFPSYEMLSPANVLDELTLSPSTHALVLRLLYGETSLIEHQEDLLLLEMLGLHTPTPIPLPLLGEWAESQLTPKSIIRTLTHPLADERQAGAALKALMMHPSFTFAMLDHLPNVSRRVSSADDVHGEVDLSHVKKPVKDALREWSSHAREVVKTINRMVANPPPALFFLAEMKRCIEAGGIWLIDETMAVEVALGMHVFGMANGLGNRHHWLIDTSSPVFNADREEVKRSVERFGYQLWQESEARQSGFGPALWVHWHGKALGTGARRMLSATQATLSNLEGLMPLLAEVQEVGGDARAHEAEEIEKTMLGIYEYQTGQYRHLTDKEKAALERCIEVAAA